MQKGWAGQLPMVASDIREEPGKESKRPRTITSTLGPQHSVPFAEPVFLNGKTWVCKAWQLRHL